MIKQVIIVRNDLKIRKGKTAVQAAHASLSAYLCTLNQEDIKVWEATGQTKICVQVDSEEELHDVYNKALEASLPCSLIKDAGRTEFKEPTYTAVAIGPADNKQIDIITKHLKLL